ncbi:MAG: uroporphyrinogen decarboxylase family protein [Kiritimatiellae bacterium]|nr:uroporphyrinogen decarboxylase family protein [Kiritimatiellia bacterium]
MAAMTSRERVLRAVNFQDTDRVPIDLGGMKASGIGVKAYNRIKARLGLNTKTRIWDPKFMIASVEDAVMRRFHLDVVPLDISSVMSEIRPDKEWAPKTLYEGAEGLLPPGTSIGTDSENRWVLLDQNRSQTSYRMPREGYYFDDISFNEPGAMIDPAAFRPVVGFTDEQLNALQARGKFLYENSEYALLGWGGGVCFLGMSLITDRMSNVTMGLPSEWMVMLMTEKETCHAMMDKSVEASIKCLKQLRDAAGDYCFAWGIAADDSGTQRGEFISPELWVEMIKPHYAKLCAWIHRNTKWKTYLHSCGSICHLIPHMIEAGVDILNPIQTSAANMEPDRLKREFGGKIVFWGGGCDTQRILPTAAPGEIRAHVRERLGIFKPGGGYVFNQVHNIQPNVPVENIIAMLDAAYEYG